MYEENWFRDFIGTWATRYSKINKYSIYKSRVPKCYAMTTNLRLKTRLVSPTYSKDCYRTFLINKQVYHGFDRNSWPKIQKSETPRLRDLAAKNSRIRGAKKHMKTRFRDSFRTPTRFHDWSKSFRVLFATPIADLHVAIIWLQLSEFLTFSLQPRPAPKPGKRPWEWGWFSLQC